MTVKAYLRYRFEYDDYEMFIKNTDWSHKVCFVDEIIWKEATDEGTLIKPAISPISGPPTKEVVQAILDAAWDNGMRPTGFSDVMNETAAIKYHLEDMRKLVFEKEKL